MKRFLKRSAFTIVEMVIVIAVIGILATVMVPTISGMIEMANKSVDQQFAANLTIQLALKTTENKISDEIALRNAINEIYGTEEEPDYYGTKFVAKSAKSGNYFWYNYINGTVFIGTVADAAAESKDLNDLMTPTMSAVPMSDDQWWGGFSDASLRSDLIPGLYLMGNKPANSTGGELIDVITRFENLSDSSYFDGTSSDPTMNYPVAMEKAMEYIGENPTEASLHSNLLQKLTTTGVAAVDPEDAKTLLVFRHDNANVTEFSVPMNMLGMDFETITAVIYDGTTAESDVDAPIVNIVDGQMNFPSGIKFNMMSIPGVQPGTNNTNYDGQTEIFVNTNNLDDLKDMFGNLMMDTVVVLPNGNRYLIDFGKIYPLPLERDDSGEIITEHVVGGLSGGNVEDIEFEISCPDASVNVGEDKVYINGTDLYIAYDYLNEEIVLKVDGFAATRFNWVLSDTTGAVSLSSTGVLTVTDKVALNENRTFTVTATLKNTQVQNQITVNLIRPMDISFNIDGNTYSNTEEMKKEENAYQINLNFTGERTFPFSNISIPAINSVLIENAGVEDVTFTTTGSNLFTIQEDKLVLNDQANYGGTQVLTVKLGDHLSFNYTVSVTDNSTSPFVLNTVQGKPLGTDFLFRVGNANKFSLNKLFDVAATNENYSGAIRIDIFDVAASGDGEALIYTSSSDATATTKLGVTVTAGTTWGETEIKFSKTGVARIRLTNSRGKSTDLLVEVINATNATGATSATSNNVVLLNNISGSFSVSNDYTFFGNGFTVTLPTTATQGGQGITGYVQLGGLTGASGHLENVKIVGHNYPKAYYLASDAKVKNTENTYEYLKSSVQILGGNSSITNCYISGSRTALLINGGDVKVTDTTVSGGALANIHVAGGNSVTFKNLTTYQAVVTADQYDKDKSTVGMGIVVTSTATNLIFEGDLKQNNWVTKSDVQTYAPSDFSSYIANLYGKSDYAKFKNGDYMNFGVVYLVEINSNNLPLDYTNCNQKDNYDKSSVSILTVTGAVWTTKNTVAVNTADPGFSAVEYTPVAPTFAFNNSANNDDDDAANDKDAYCVYDSATKTIKIGLNDTVTFKDLDLSGITITNYDGNEVADYTVKLNGKDVTGTVITINPSNGNRQELVITATSDAGYDKTGKPRVDESGKPIKITTSWTVAIEVESLAFPDPVWNMGGNYKFDKNSGMLYAYYKTSQGYGEAVPIYEGIKINYYNKQGQLVELNLSGTTTIPTGSDGDNAKEFSITLDDGAVLTMKYSSGLKSGATTHQFANYGGKIYFYPKELDNDNYVRAKTTNQDFDVKISYTFTDPNGKSITQTMRWYNAKDSNSSVATKQWKDFDSANGKSSSGCFAEGSLVTLADGTQKPIEEITFEDQILAWDFNTGKYAVTVASLIDRYETSQQNVINLKFSDGTVVRMVVDHGFFDVDANKFVFLNEENVASYVGHTFVKASEDGTYENVELVGYEITVETVAYYSIQTAFYNNCIVDGMFTLCAPPDMIQYSDWFNYFEIGEGMKYDEEKMQADIEQYGLYTYEDFAEYVTYEQFMAFNGPYLKVLVGREVVTYEQIIELIGIYVNFEN